MTRIPFGIRGTGSAVPETVLTNAQLSEMVDTSDEWITKRTGIKERRILAEGESMSDLCIQAAKIALEDAGVTPDEIDLIIVGTVTPDRQVPAVACKIQHALNCGTIGAFDMMAGCSGFVYASNVAAQYLWSGTHKNVPVIGAEALTRIVNYRDRTSCLIFGDGAGAVVYSTDFEHGEVLSTSLNADGGGYDIMYQTAGGSETPVTPEHLEANEHKLVIRGREVYKFAVNRLVELVRREQSNNPELVLGGVVPHQVNLRIIESARERLDLSADRIFTNIQRYGNTSSASVPVALDEARRTGFMSEMDGKLLVMCAFGAGLTWGSLGVRW